MDNNSQIISSVSVFMMRCLQHPSGVHAGSRGLTSRQVLCRALSSGPRVTFSHRSSCRTSRVLVARSSVDPDELHENKLGPNVAAGIKDVKNTLTWRPATVIRNE